LRRALTILILVIGPSVFVMGADVTRRMITDLPKDKVADYFGRWAGSQLTQEDSLELTSFRFAGGTFNSFFNFESVLPTVDSLVDFSQYDANGDSVVDAVVFVRSGNGEEDSGDADDIWSYEAVYALGGGPVPCDVCATVPESWTCP
jgi:hypothetical protein